MAFRLVIFFFGLLALTLSAEDSRGEICNISQKCDCEVSLARSCTSLECCALLDSDGTLPPVVRMAAKRDETTLIVQCLCCSCANITCKTTIDFEVDLDITEIESSNGDGGGGTSALEKPTVQFRDVKEERTIADFHRELLEDRLEVRDCLDIQQECSCEVESDSCSDARCCEVANNVPLEFSQLGSNRNTPPRQMVMRGGNEGIVLVECDCCSCIHVDCSDDVEVEIDVTADFLVGGGDG